MELSNRAVHDCVHCLATRVLPRLDARVLFALRHTEYNVRMLGDLLVAARPADDTLIFDALMDRTLHTVGRAQSTVMFTPSIGRACTMTHARVQRIKAAIASLPAAHRDHDR